MEVISPAHNLVGVLRLISGICPHACEPNTFHEEEHSRKYVVKVESY